MKIIRHFFVTVIFLAAAVGIPFSQTAYFKGLISDEKDAVASASVIIDSPSGEYVVLINRDKHPDEKSMELWKSFFSEGDIDVLMLFEDIDCTVSKSDATGITMAQSFQSRLAENQMKITESDPTLMISKADSGRFDVIVMSAELADRLGAESVNKREQTVMLRVKGDSDEKS